MIEEVRNFFDSGKRNVAVAENLKTGERKFVGRGMMQAEVQVHPNLPPQVMQAPFEFEIPVESKGSLLEQLEEAFRNLDAVMEKKRPEIQRQLTAQLRTQMNGPLIQPASSIPPTFGGQGKPQA